ncbi:MAG: hypothetical protein HXX20_24965, partial [Chloroflexi bacterium]|nr:hypothetical protein [Chloroflexota bacterium]
MEAKHAETKTTAQPETAGAESSEQEQEQSPQSMWSVLKQAQTDPRRLSPNQVIQLQTTVGNQAVMRLLNKGTVQRDDDAAPSEAPYQKRNRARRLEPINPKVPLKKESPLKRLAPITPNQEPDFIQASKLKGRLEEAYADVLKLNGSQNPELLTSLTSGPIASSFEMVVLPYVTSSLTKTLVEKVQDSGNKEIKSNRKALTAGANNTAADVVSQKQIELNSTDPEKMTSKQRAANSKQKKQLSTESNYLGMGNTNKQNTQKDISAKILKLTETTAAEQTLNEMFGIVFADQKANAINQIKQEAEATAKKALQSTKIVELGRSLRNLQ